MLLAVHASALSAPSARGPSASVVLVAASVAKAVHAPLQAAVALQVLAAAAALLPLDDAVLLAPS